METGTAILFIVILAVTIKGQQAGSKAVSLSQYLLLMIFGAAIVYLRIEFAMIVMLCCMTILVSDLSRKRSFVTAMVDASPLAVGALSAMLSIRVIFGHFLPDTALAKSSHASLEPIRTSLQVLSSSFAFGAGLALFWALSVILLTLRNRQKLDPHASNFILILENIPIFIVIALSCTRGQAIQAVRYIEWTFVFGIVSNALQIWRDEAAQSHAPVPFRPIEKNLVIAFFFLLFCLLPFDWKYAAKIQRGRTKTFLTMRSAPLGSLFAGKNIVASDVGFITYFTNGNMCDLAGLVNGREAAALTFSQRAAACLQQAPAMLFLTVGQIEHLTPLTSFRDWTVCGIYDFTNVNSNDRHYLLVPSSQSQKVCSKLNFSPKAVHDFIPNA